LDKHALENVKDAYKALPSYKSLKFEYMVRTTMELVCNHETDVVPVRLVLGHLKSSRKRPRLAVHAYIRMKNQHSKMFLRLGDGYLTVRLLDHLEFVAPFNMIYDTYGMTERAMSGLCTMAAYYFLAAGHVEAIMTRSDYRMSFSALCTKIQPLQEMEGAWNSDDETATDTAKTPPRALEEPGRVDQGRPYQRNGLALQTENASTPAECKSQILEHEMARSGHDATIVAPAISGKLSVDNHDVLESRGKTPVSVNIFTRVCLATD
jgi:hypothetical protein